jgi:hypothetical protein
MHEFARVSRAIIHGAAKSKKLPDPSNNYLEGHEEKNHLFLLISVHLRVLCGECQNTN